MNITITIDCETDGEILAHLHTISKRVTKEIKDQKGEITKAVYFEDDNCYGTHKVSINPTQP